MFTLNKLSIRLLYLRGTCTCAHPQTCILNLYCRSTYQLFLTQTIEKRTFKQRLALAHDSSLHNNQRVKTTQIFDNRWQKEQDVYIQTTEYYPTLPWCADTSRSLPEWQKTVTKDLVHHSTRQVCEEFFMEQQRTDRTSINFIIGSSCLRVSAVWELWRWTPGTLSR